MASLDKASRAAGDADADAGPAGAADEWSTSAASSDPAAIASGTGSRTAATTHHAAAECNLAIKCGAAAAAAGIRKDAVSATGGTGNMSSSDADLG
ncbi:TPA: hypothetical protein ACH3X1_013818 [Trebouxia sp. C0004]